MPMQELVEWVAFERTNGPILPHERLDIGFAQTSYYLVSLLGKSRRGRRWQIRDFLPPWMCKPESMDEKQLRATFESWSTGGELPFQ